VRVSFDAWKQGNVASAQQVMEIVPAAPDPPLTTVSSQLEGELILPNKKGMLQGLGFSPDGKRLVAGDGSAGVIQIWDVASRKLSISIEAGKITTERRGGGRGGEASFALSPDWQKLYAKNGAEVSVWDPQSGKQIDTLQDKLMTNVRSLMLSSDGNALIATAGRAGGLIWDTSTKKSQPLPENLSLSSGALSRDGKLFASVQSEGFYSSAIQVIDLETRKVRTTIEMPNKLAHAYVTDFTPDGNILRGAIEIYDEHLWQKWEKWQYTTKFWDVATGKEVASFPTDESETTYTMASYSADGKTLAGSRWTPRHGTRAEKLHANLTTGAKLFLVDVPGKRTRGIVLQEDAVVAAIAFSPDSKLVAVVTQPRGRGDGPEAGDGDTAPQPRIHLVDAQEAKVRESLIAPPGQISALSFSPDGRTLASAGLGKVLLWVLPSSAR
jgi:WD40 repeat protein